MSDLKQHPLSSAFPAMSADDFAALVEDIKANGQREPVMVFEDMVLDGWHRYRACLQLGIKAQQFTFGGADPVSFVLSHNLHRRHLTPSQRAAAVVSCSDWTPANVGRPRDKARGEPGSPLGKTTAEMAKAAQVSDKTIKDAKAVHKAGLTEAVKEGAMTVKEAAKVARGKPEPQQKTEVLKSPEPANADELSEAHHTITELASENEELRDKLAVESLMEPEDAKTQTSETIRELRALVKTLQAENAALKVSRDTYQREASEAKKSAHYWRKQAEKAAKDSA